MILLLLQNGFFSREWVSENISKSDRPGFFRYKRDMSNANDVNRKLSVLAESLFNLSQYGVEGLDEFVLTLRDDPSEGRFAELNLAVALARTGCVFRFHHPAKPPVKGDNYDFDVLIGNYVVPTEAKCRTDGITLDARTIGHKLKKAGNKLPPGRPGGVLIKTPVDWLSETNNELDEAVHKFIKNYSRVVCVTAFATYEVPYGAGVKIKHRYKEFRSAVHAFDMNVNWSILRKDNRADWIRIQEMVEFYAAS